MPRSLQYRLRTVGQRSSAIMCLLRITDNSPMDVTTRSNVRVGGHGRVTMIFSHGFWCDQSMWRSVAPSFDDRYRTVLFDLVGSGGSDMSCYDYHQKYGSLHGYADDVLENLDHFADGPAVFVGHSVSAMIGMLGAIRAPERFIANIIVGPSPSFLNDGDYMGGFTRSDIEGSARDARE